MIRKVALSVMAILSLLAIGEPTQAAVTQSGTVSCAFVHYEGHPWESFQVIGAGFAEPVYLSLTWPNYGTFDNIPFTSAAWAFVDPEAGLARGKWIAIVSETPSGPAIASCSAKD
jgi:hypothetical protein